MYETPKAGEHRSPKNSHYVSRANGHVYPAMRNLPGYEDDNPADWRAATAAEIEAYKKGAPVRPEPAEATLDLASPPSAPAAPSSIRLQDDEPPSAPPAPEADPSDPPQLPPDLAAGVAPAPAPAFPAAPAPRGR